MVMLLTVVVPAKEALALPRVVKIPAAEVVPPIAVPSIVPPVIVTLLAFCVAIVPRPKFVRAVAVLAKATAMDVVPLPVASPDRVIAWLA